MSRESPLALFSERHLTRRTCYVVHLTTSKCACLVSRTATRTSVSNITTSSGTCPKTWRAAWTGIYIFMDHRHCIGNKNIIHLTQNYVYLNELSSGLTHSVPSEYSPWNNENDVNQDLKPYYLIRFCLQSHSLSCSNFFYTMWYQKVVKTIVIPTLCKLYCTLCENTTNDVLNISKNKIKKNTTNRKYYTFIKNHLLHLKLLKM